LIRNDLSLSDVKEYRKKKVRTLAMCLGDMAEVWKALGKASLVQHSQHPRTNRIKNLIE